MLHTLLSVSIIFFIVYGIEGSGVSPEEILARVNDNFTITCFVDVANGELNFYIDDELAPNGSVTQINEKRIELTHRFSRPTKKNFTCKKDQSNVGQTLVRVDDKVEPVSDFRCRTSNLTTVICSFKQPTSFVPIKYKLRFSLNGGKMKHKAELRGDGNFGYSSSINVTSMNLAETNLRFTLLADNKFTTSKEKFSMKLLETLTPKKVEEMRVGDSTTHDSSIVTFTLPKELEVISRELAFDVRINNEYDDGRWKRIENPRLQVKDTQGFLALDGLEFANTKYKVKLRMKAKIALDTSEMWSSFVEVSFATKPKAPEKVPETCRNCFNVMDNGNALVYWTAVPRKFQNANNFSYRVIVSNEHGNKLINRDLLETSLELQKDLNAEIVKIEIFSVNEKGISINSSRLFVPIRQLESNKKLFKVYKQIVNNKYRISWKFPELRSIESFSMVSCRQRNELPNQCDGSVNIVHFKPEANEFLEEIKFSKQFGIAANLRNSSLVQGFQWAACTASKPNEIGQVHSLWSNVITNHSIMLQWQLNCVDEPIVAGYNITYCSIPDGMNHCDELLRWNSTMDKDLRHFELFNLKAYKHYRISIALLSNTRHGIFKPPTFIRTLESAPTAPRNLKAFEVLQNSVDLTWNRPKEMNGEAMTYQLWYNGHKININDNHTMNETFSFKLRDLEAFTNYSIVVEACTSFCSELNENMELRTAMGKPGVMLQPRLELIGNNKLSISWEKPKVVGGNLDYFQLKTVLRNGDEKLYRVSGQARSCVVRSLNCENEKIEFSIRSVNVEFPSITDVDTESFECFDFQELTKGETAGRFYGEWSQTTTFYCPIHFSMSVMAMIFLFSLSSLIFIYAIIRLYQKYKDMKDIHIIWPKGLDPSSPNASPSKKDYLFDPTKDLDLIKDHVLTDIEEEEEKLVPAKGESNVDQRESVRSEVFLPFICNPKTNEVFYSMPKASTVNKKPSTNSTPTSPNYVKFQTKVEKPEYVKMYAPLESPTSPVIEGYLDMTGKSSSTPKIVVTPPIPLSPTTPKDNDYLVNEVKIFIKDSELNNNGYIGKRSSLLSDGSEKKHPMIINSNGYVGLQQK